MDKETLFQYEWIRRNGETNMYDRNRVMQIANREGFHALVDAAAEDYMKVLNEYEEVDEAEFKTWLSNHEWDDEDDEEWEDEDDEYEDEYEDDEYDDEEWEDSSWYPMGQIARKS